MRPVGSMSSSPHVSKQFCPSAIAPASLPSGDYANGNVVVGVGRVYPLFDLGGSHSGPVYFFRGIFELYGEGVGRRQGG